MSQPIRGQGGHLVFPIGPKNTNLVEDVEILLPVKFHWIPFSGFRGEVENVSANQRKGRPSCFSDRPEKHKLGRGRWDVASCQASLNSVKRFQRRSRKCEKLTTTDDHNSALEPLAYLLIGHMWVNFAYRYRLNKSSAMQESCGNLAFDPWPKINRVLITLTCEVWKQSGKSCSLYNTHPGTKNGCFYCMYTVNMEIFA